MSEEPSLIACSCCDALHRRSALGPGQVANCRRCGAELDRHPGRGRGPILPLTLACLILFMIANAFPIVVIEVQGLESQTTLAGAVYQLSAEGMAPVAALVLGTTIVFPFVHLLALLYLLLPLDHHPLRARFGWVVRGILSLRPWGMIEVFLLGVLVAIVKLAGMATVIPGAALWAFVALTVLLTVVLGFDPRRFWQPGDVQRSGA